MARRPLISTLFVLITLCASVVHSLTNYANVFVNPNFIIAGNFNVSTHIAQQTIVSWATQWAGQGPWSVVNKQMTPPSGDKHDYMSFSPYAWPDCSGVGNTTELTPEQIWTTCPYVTKDGQFNPDARMVNNIGDFDDMANAILYNALSFAITGKFNNGSDNVAEFVKTWFLDAATLMNPNLNYAQMKRGPGGQVGTHTGVLDLKCMTKIASAVLILRGLQPSNWTADLDTSLNAWANNYIHWLTTADIAIQEAESPNNHGSFYFNQLASLQVLVGDTDGAKDTLQKYFSTLFQGQIAGNGEQPLESDRTRPYHYRAYNLAAMITNAKLAEYVGFAGAWDTKSSSGGTIKQAVDFAMGQPAGDDDPTELYPHVAAVARKYGDPNNTYANFLAKGTSVSQAPFFLWDQLDNVYVPPPPSSSSVAHAAAKTTTTSSNSSKATGKSSSKSSAASKLPIATSLSSLTLLFVASASIL